MLTREDYKRLLDERAADDLTPVRQVEIHNELSSSYGELMTKAEELESKLAENDKRLNEHRDAMALMYSQLHAEKVQVGAETVEKEEIMNTISVSDLLSKKR